MLSSLVSLVNMIPNLSSFYQAFYQRYCFVLFVLIIVKSTDQERRCLLPLCPAAPGVDLLSYTKQQLMKECLCLFLFSGSHILEHILV